MNKIRSWWSLWKQDRLLQKVIRNTGYLFSGNTASMVLTTIMGFMVAILLGPSQYGALGIIVMYASSINRLLSFRMGELVIKYAGHHLAQHENARAGTIIKTAVLSEAFVSLLAYLFLLLTATLAARIFLKDIALAPLIQLYGLMLLANLVTESATAVLQLNNAYRVQAALNLAQSLLSFVWAGAVYLSGGGLAAVINAYLAGKVLMGVGTAIAAFIRFPVLTGTSWRKTPLHLPENWKEMLRFGISTNLSSTINLLIRDSEVLWVGLFLSKVEAGYYKFALAVMNIILMPVAPLIQTTFPEITRSASQRNWKPLKSMLGRTTLIAALWTGACAIGLLIGGKWLLSLISSGAYLPSLPAIAILLVGYGLANILFWNRPLLLAFGLPGFPLKVSAAVGAVKTALMFVLVRPFGYLAQAGLMSAYLAVTVLINLLKGLSLLRHAVHQQPPGEEE